MDIFTLNYRQLQLEAKKFGIKANQKIDVLRDQLKEEYEKSINNRTNLDHSDLSLLELHNDKINFLVDLPVDRSISPKSINVSTDDLDEIFDSNRRHSQFFDDVVQLSTTIEEKIDGNENSNCKSQSLLIESDFINTQNNSFNLIAEINSIDDNDCNKNRNLNETYDMDEIDLENSQITVEQRKKVGIDTKNQKEDFFKVPLKNTTLMSIENVSKVQTSDNMQKSIVSKISNKSSFLKRKSQTMFIDSKKLCKASQNSSNCNNNKKPSNSTFVPETKSSLNNKRTNIGRPSIAVSHGKNDRRTTFATSHLPKPTWRS